MLRKLLRAVVFIVEAIITPPGTNLLGLTLAFIIFLPLGFVVQKLGGRIEGAIEGLLNFIGGCLMFAVDWIYRSPREFVAGQSLTDLKWDCLSDPKRGGRIFSIPCWIWGGLWMISGIIITIIELIKG